MTGKPVMLRRLDVSCRQRNDTCRFDSPADAESRRSVLPMLVRRTKAPLGTFSILIGVGALEGTVTPRECTFQAFFPHLVLPLHRVFCHLTGSVQIRAATDR